MNDYYVYAHINPFTGHIFYIGKGKGDRCKSLHRRSERWHNYIRKYGCVIHILEDQLTQEDAFKREVYYIDKIGRKDLGKGELINMSDGGVGGNNNKGRKLSEEWRRKIGLAGRGRVGAMRGKAMPEETKNKISQSLKGRPATWLKGKNISPEQLAARMAKEKKCCEFCGHYYNGGNYAKWHGENCNRNPKKDEEWKSKILTIDQQKEIIWLAKNRKTKNEIARIFNVNPKTICKIIKNRQLYQVRHGEIPDQLSGGPFFADQENAIFVEYKGEKISLRRLYRESNSPVSIDAVKKRIKKLKWSVEDALFIPPHSGLRKTDSL